MIQPVCSETDPRFERNRGCSGEEIRLCHVEKFSSRSLWLGRFLLRMDSKCGQALVNKANLSTCSEDTDPIVVIHDPIEILAECANLFSRAARPKHFRLDEVTPSPPDPPQVEAFFETSDIAPVQPDQCARLIDNVAPAMKDVAIGMTSCISAKRIEGSRQIIIIAIQIGDDVARGSCQSFVDCVGLSPSGSLIQ